MAKGKSTVIIYPDKIKQLADAQTLALKQTAERLLEDVRRSRVMPFDSSHLQDTATVVDESQAESGKVSIVSQTPYARRLYFHPEYNFQTKDNPNARGKWYEPWEKGGEKQDFCDKTFKKLFKQIGGV